jgi:hypothetical protein
MSNSKLFARFATDQDKEESGVWVDFGEGIKVKVRRLKSRASQDARKELDKPFANEIRRGKLSTDVAEDLLIKQIAWGVIADWQGVDDENGTPLPYSREAAYQILKKLPDFRDEVFAVSVDSEGFKAQDNADAVGN